MKLELARRVGAQVTLVSDGRAAARVRELTGGAGGVRGRGAGRGAGDGRCGTEAEAEVVLVGIGAGGAKVGFGMIACDAAVRAPYWGSRSELGDVLELARTGAVEVHVETCGIGEAPRAYERLHAGEVDGRAVILPNG